VRTPLPSAGYSFGPSLCVSARSMVVDDFASTVGGVVGAIHSRTAPRVAGASGKERLLRQGGSAMVSPP